MSKIILLPLEPYKERYTEFLYQWELLAFKNHFDVVEPILPSRGVGSIVSGRVLDSNARPQYCYEQLSQLYRGGFDDADAIYFSDMFHPGIEGLRYSGYTGQIGCFCWAQTFDVYDFTFEQHVAWMRHYERMILECVDFVFVAHPMLRELIVAAVPEAESKVVVVGLPFNSDLVSTHVETQYAKGLKIDCVYSSRWDEEKNPNFFLDVVEANPGLNFAICTGSSQLRGTDKKAIQRANKLDNDGRLKIYSDLKKGEYYSLLSNSTVQFNCARQDWISFTLLEALTFGCEPLYPLTRSFDILQPFTYNHYLPEVVEDASFKLQSLIRTAKNGGESHQKDIQGAILGHMDQSLDRIAQLLKR